MSHKQAKVFEYGKGKYGEEVDPGKVKKICDAGKCYKIASDGSLERLSSAPKVQAGAHGGVKVYGEKKIIYH